MAADPISRRALVPLAATAVLAAGAGFDPAPAEAAVTHRRGSICGPCRIWPGHTISLQFFLPAVRGANRSGQHRLILKSLDGTEIVRHDFQLQPGTGVELTLAAQADGTLLFNGQPLAGDVHAQLVVIAIIAILIALPLPAVQPVRATATSFVPGRAAGEQTADYLLPFVEQDNLTA